MTTRRIESLWKNMQARCTTGSAIQKKCPTYLECRCEWSTQSEFSNWAILEYGFDKLDHRGKVWELDKDLYSDGNKLYGPDTCVFVPHRINTLFSSSGRTRGLLPQGVTFDSYTGKYAAQVRVSGKQVKLGRKDTPYEAHRLWQCAKLEIIIKAIQSSELGEKALSFIDKRVQSIKNAIVNEEVIEWGMS